MALFKICRGLEANLPTTLTNGYAYFCTNTGNFYIDHLNAQSTLVRSKISAQYADKLRYVDGDTTIEIDPSQILTSENYAEVIGAVTTEKGGLMSSADKVKLDSIPAGIKLHEQSDWNENDTTSDAYIQNRTHWKTVEYVTFIDNQTFEFDTTSEPSVAIIDDIILPLEEGSTYTLVIDGDSYECVAYTYSGLVCIGNLSIVDPEANDTQEPFLIYTTGTTVSTFASSTKTGGIGVTLEGDTHTISLSGNTVTYHKINEKYLPTLIGRTGSAAGAEVFNEYTGINKATGEHSHAEGLSTTASGNRSHAEDWLTTASEANAHAEGYWTTASGANAHAEGNNTAASDNSAHAEGIRTTASAEDAHAEGRNTKATAWNAHAEGQYTEAAGRSQHVEGEYNIVDAASGISQRGKYVHIVGNGSSEEAKSNAHTLDWSGNAWFKGEVKVGGTSQDDTAAKTLATTDAATTETNGLMSADDKTKLDSVAEGANNYVLPTASETVVGGIMVGENLTITDGKLAAKDTTYEAATTIVDGLMSAADKAKLDAIPAPENIVTTATIFDYIIMKDQANGMNYIVCMRNGNLVSYSPIASITLVTPPDKLTYTEGEYLDTTGMVVNAVYEDGSTKEITDYVCDNYVTVDNPVFTITYVENNVEYTLTIEVTVTAFDEMILQDFTYEKQDDGTYLITGWNGTVNGVESPEEMVVPNNGLIVI